MEKLLLAGQAQNQEGQRPAKNQRGQRTQFNEEKLSERPIATTLAIFVIQPIHNSYCGGDTNANYKINDDESCGGCHRKGHRIAESSASSPAMFRGRFIGPWPQRVTTQTLPHRVQTQQLPFREGSNLCVHFVPDSLHSSHFAY